MEFQSVALLVELTQSCKSLQCGLCLQCWYNEEDSSFLDITAKSMVNMPVKAVADSVSVTCTYIPMHKTNWYFEVKMSLDVETSLVVIVICQKPSWSDLMASVALALASGLGLTTTLRTLT